MFHIKVVFQNGQILPITSPVPAVITQLPGGAECFEVGYEGHDITHIPVKNVLYVEQTESEA